jgi:hypothetical protein
MEKYVHVHVIGTKEPVVIEAHTVEDKDLHRVIVKHKGTVVGEFKESQIAGWSLHDLDED